MLLRCSGLMVARYAKVYKKGDISWCFAMYIACMHWWCLFAQSKHHPPALLSVILSTVATGGQKISFVANLLLHHQQRICLCNTATILICWSGSSLSLQLLVQRFSSVLNKRWHTRMIIMSKCMVAHTHTHSHSHHHHHRGVVCAYKIYIHKYTEVFACMFVIYRTYLRNYSEDLVRSKQYYCCGEFTPKAWLLQRPWLKN